MGKERLDENTRVWILEAAIAKVSGGKDPDIEMSDAEKEAYKDAVEELEMKKKLYGDKFDEIEFDVSYDN